MRTFQYSDAKSHKFWNIELTGKSFTVTYGRVGSAGQTQTKTFATEALAQKEQDKLVKEKLAKGYSETTPSAAPQPSSLRVALEGALVEDPGNLANHMAYADWLTEQGDPKGEFIQVQMRLEQEGLKPADRKKLQTREQQLLKKHGKEWLGDLADVSSTADEESEAPPRLTFHWSRGWPDSLEIENLNVNLSRRLVAAPQLRLLRRLSIISEAMPGDDYEFEPGRDVPEDSDAPALFSLTRAKHLGNVRVLQIGEQVPNFLQQQSRNDCYYNCHMSGEAAVGLVKLMPKLEELYLLAHRVDTNQLFSLKTLNHLRTLQVYHLNRDYPLARLAKNPSLGKLTHLLIHPHGLDHEEPYISLEGLRAVVRSTNLPSLTHLQLRLTNFSDRGIAEIVKSGVLKHLKMLDLRGGTVTDEGARLLAACPDVKNLQVLELSRNRMTEAGIAALRATGVTLWADDQWVNEPETDTMYLYEADPE
jgi:uncharacterized protein (TIGR02996 family)